MILNYTVINHLARKKLDVSINEYLVADCIYQLSNNPKSITPGWSYASKEYIASFLGLSRATVFRAIDSLVSAGLVDKSEEKNLLKTTEKWYNCVVINTESQNETDSLKMRRKSLKMIQKKSQNDTDTIININNKYNNKYNSIKNITEKDLQEIADKYQVSIGYVKLQFEKLKNYCESKGKRYKNYKAALRNFVIGDMQRSVERRVENGNRREVVDASNLRR